MSLGLSLFDRVAHYVKHLKEVHFVAYGKPSAGSHHWVHVFW